MDSRRPGERFPHPKPALRRFFPRAYVAHRRGHRREILDLYELASEGFLDDCCEPELLQAPLLNPLLAAGRPAWSALRETLSQLLRANGDPRLREADLDRFFVERDTARMCVPMEIGDYVDFYSSLEHATNLGRIFRPNAEALLPNWRWIPIGYHGRSGTIVIDGTPVRRPRGQRKPPSAPAPEFGPSRRLDIELEMGFVTGPGNRLGEPIAASDAAEHIFGLVLVNDWSARDIQAWEYQPLGPFLGKSFATTVSPWIVTLDALEPFRVEGPEQDPKPLEYLRIGEPWAYAIRLAVDLQTQRMRERGAPPEPISQTTFRDMYWNVAQQLAHATVNGAITRPGDLFASGTISGSEPRHAGQLDRAQLERRTSHLAAGRGDAHVLGGRGRGHAARLVRATRRAPNRVRLRAR